MISNSFQISKIDYYLHENISEPKIPLSGFFKTSYSTEMLLHLISYWESTLTSLWKVRRKYITIILDNKIPFILLHNHISFLPWTERFRRGSRLTIQDDRAPHLHLNQLLHRSLWKIWSRSWKGRKREWEFIFNLIF